MHECRFRAVYLCNPAVTAARRGLPGERHRAPRPRPAPKPALGCFTPTVLRGAAAVTFVSHSLILSINILLTL